MVSAFSDELCAGCPLLLDPIETDTAVARVCCVVAILLEIGNSSCQEIASGVRGHQAENVKYIFGRNFMWGQVCC